MVPSPYLDATQAGILGDFPRRIHGGFTLGVGSVSRRLALGAALRVLLASGRIDGLEGLRRSFRWTLGRGCAGEFAGGGIAGASKSLSLGRFGRVFGLGFRLPHPGDGFGGFSCGGVGGVGVVAVVVVVGVAVFEL